MTGQPSMPRDTGAEQILLGLFTQGDEAAVDAAREQLSEADFYDPFHAHVFAAVLALAKRSQRPDTVLIRSELQLAGKLLAGGDERLLALSNTLHTGDPEHLVARLRSLAIARGLINTAMRVASEGCGGLEDVDDFIDRAQRSVLAACERRGDGVEMTTLASAVTSAIEELQRRAASPNRLLGASTGIASLDRQTGGYCPGDVIVVAGRPGMGKSAFAQQAARVAAQTSGGKAAVVFSLEMQSTMWAQRLLAAGAPLNVKSVRTGESIGREDWENLIAEGERLSDLPMYVPSTTGITPLGIKRILRKLRAKHGGIALAVLDYIQLARADGRNDNREQEVASVSRALKQMALEFDCPFMALSQLNRSCESRSDRRPMLSDLRESGAIEQDADIVLGLYRDEVYRADTTHKGICEVLILKQRNGPVGVVPAMFEQQYTRFGNLSHEAEQAFYDGEGE